MKILLVKPTSNKDSITQPLGLGYLATSLRPRHNVRIADGPKISLNSKKFAAILNEFKPDIVGFNIVTLDFHIARKYAGIAKEILHNVIVVAGGPHPSGEPEEVMQTYTPNIDYVFVGEAEKGLRTLADCLEEGDVADETMQKIPGLVWKSGDEIKQNPSCVEPDLDSLGFPAWDLMDPRTYPRAPHAAFSKAFPVANIIATRGCPYDCVFCAAKKIQGRKIRRRSVGHLMEEIDLLVKRYGAREIHIVDDNFTFDRDYVLDFCENLSSAHPKIGWTCPNGVRLDTLDKELLVEMKRAGCHSLAVGIESGSQSVLDSVKKKQTIELVRERVQLIDEVGMKAVGFFGIGFPGEKIEDMENTVAFSLSMPLSRAQYMMYHPMPGTSQYRELLKNSPEKIRNIYSALDTIAYLETGVTEKQLKRMQRGAFLRFYLRPRQFFDLLFSIKGPEHAYHVFKRIFRWMVAG